MINELIDLYSTTCDQKSLITLIVGHLAAESALYNSFIRMFYPYIIYLVLEYTYSKTNYATEYKDRKINIVSISLGMIFTVIVIIIMVIHLEYFIQIVL